MVNDSNSINSKLSNKALDPSLSETAASETPKKTKNDQVSKNEFLNLLVAQLKAQDPLDPMKSEQFAVNLAQFSQLEQLVSINDKLGGGQDLSTLAGYLGNEVTLNSDTVHVGTDGTSTVKVTVPTDSASLKVELLDSAGKVQGTLDFGAVGKGEQSLSLEGQNIPAGDYQIRVVSLGADGSKKELEPAVTGIVTGFVPGANPSLIVNGKEVTTDQILAVNLPRTGGNNAPTT